MWFPWLVRYPYQNDEMLNLDWLLADVKSNVEKMDTFINLNTIKYADPILWNITTQYEANTVVVDPVTGTAYISVQAVPSGIGLNNTDYWTVIFTMDIMSANKNITLRDDANNPLATFESAVDDWLLSQGNLYVVTRSIDIGEAYVVDYNIERRTVEDFLKEYIVNLYNRITDIIGSLDDLDTTDKDSIVDAINEVLSTITTVVGDLDDLITIDKDNLVAAINEIVGAVSTLSINIGDLSDLDTTDQDSIVDAINEIVSVLTTLNTNLTYELSVRAKCYVTVADMIADENLADNDVVSTLGYHAAGIGGATYEISTTAGTAAITLDNGLYANIQVSDDIHIAQLGAQSNDDISSLLVNAITLINTRGIVHLDAWYKISSTVNITLYTNDNLTIDGHENNITFDNNSSAINFTVSGIYDRNVNIINCDFIGNNSNTCLSFTGFSSALNRNEIRNCNFSNFKNNIFIQNSRMFLIDNIAIWGLPDDGIGINLYGTGTGFVGDLEIKNSQFTTANGASGNGAHIVFNLASGATAAGVIIDSCDFYEADYCIKNLGNGTYNDIWVINSQFDGASNYSINFIGSGKMTDIHIKNNYDTAPKNFLTLYMPTSTNKAIFVEGNYVNGYAGTQPAININCNNKSSVNISENIFINSKNTSGALIGVYNVRAAKVSSNICDMDSGNYLYNVVELNNCVNAICTNNIANNVASTAYMDVSNTNKVFANNIP